MTRRTNQLTYDRLQLWNPGRETWIWTCQCCGKDQTIDGTSLRCVVVCWGSRGWPYACDHRWLLVRSPGRRYLMRRTVADDARLRVQYVHVEG